MRYFGRVVTAIFSIISLTFLFQNCDRRHGFSESSLLTGGEAQLSSLDISSSKFLSYKAGGEIPAIFGFFADAMQGVGTGNYIRNTSKYANIHFVSGNSPSMVAEKIKLVHSEKTNAILMLQNQIFDWKSARLQSQAMNQLIAIKKRLDADKTLESVVAVYVIDEPFWTNSLNSKALSNAQVYQNLDTAAHMVRTVFGNDILVMSSEAYPVLDRHLTQKDWVGFPPSYDLLAINCYLAFGAVCDSDEKYLTYVDTLESVLKPNQKLFLTLDNYWNSMEGTKFEIQERLINRTNLQMQIAKDRNIKVLVSFLYQSMPAAVDNLVGLDQMAHLFKHIQGISDVHLSKSVALAPQAKSCLKSNVILSCSVDGIKKDIPAVVEESGKSGDRTQRHSLAPGYRAVRMQVEWTCSEGRWVFTHPEGWCNLESTAPKAICTGGVFKEPSVDGSNTCEWVVPDKLAGASIGRVQGTNQGWVEAICSPTGSGKWNFNYHCPNKSGVQSCAGGGQTISSADGSNECRFQWPDTAAGITLNKASDSGGGTLTATCKPNSGWNISYFCPNKSGLKSCDGGAIPDYPSSSGGKACGFSWPLTNAGQTVSLDSYVGKGKVTARCDSSGKWQELKVICE